ncbi:hypothetical protein RhiirA5_505652 [Rhizophagus irregularis]|uniref:NYN domain-containing protein n=1 Tax=Rhizophagus irregularis TaxID=588596 RepID=A0A2N0QWP5_9GLOM|nr:hypothetical protein RhiirA5_505652 [Rhizophagus irregularis]PKC55484.1 hypothetical protein RhiirA1_542495 [Rhizophagus irregularis]CAB4494337.1 unnamed protein product [Rhizophagus irregularis]CAB5125742.1 unnamed protein product [Rhizophagus irregularis]
MSAVYQEIKRLTQELPKENFTKIIAHISKDVDLTNQMKDALDLFDADEEKCNYLITFLNSIGAEQPVAAGTRSLDRVYFFVDNSNVTIEGGYFIRSQKPGRFLSSNNKIIFVYGLLFKKIRGNRELGGNPIIVGSEISPNDSIYNQGYDVKFFKHNCKGKEQGVDNFITLKMTTTFCDEKRPSTLILIAGDGDYFETLLEAIKRKWKVEVWFWSDILNCFNNHEPTKLCKKHLFPIIVSDDLKLSFPTTGASDKIKYEAKIHYTQLETCYKFFIYINGNPYNGMESLEITSCTMIENREIMEWLAKLNLFSWINRENDSIFLYFNNKAELKTAKEWIMKEHKEIVIWEKTVQRRKPSRFYKHN